MHYASWNQFNYSYGDETTLLLFDSIKIVLVQEECLGGK
uniref:Uncharacterized protein n=1 Tax=Rhizophora mucronata TaxID=61149 RepID=A0A2P2NM44_RHIMU